MYQAKLEARPEGKVMSLLGAAADKETQIMSTFDLRGPVPTEGKG